MIPCAIIWDFIFFTTLSVITKGKLNLKHQVDSQNSKPSIDCVNRWPSRKGLHKTLTSITLIQPLYHHHNTYTLLPQPTKLNKSFMSYKNKAIYFSYMMSDCFMHFYVFHNKIGFNSSMTITVSVYTCIYMSSKLYDVLIISEITLELFTIILYCNILLWNWRVILHIVTKSI